jgi:arabinose-5-phosphate isomerase
MTRKPVTDALAVARRVVRQEGEALLALADRLGPDFARAVDLIHGCAGKVVVTGMGKSGLVARKIAATLASTGTPAFFLHAAEAVHGDLGMVTDRDVVLALSNSGETQEVLAVVPTLRRLGPPIVAITADRGSSLGKVSQVVIETGRIEEAGTLGLAPTTSTTAALALGDALAIALLERRGLTSEQFALFHPSGSLGRKLLLTVEDLMHTGLPKVARAATMREAIVAMTAGRLGVAGVIGEGGELVGCVTDGDLRRGLEKFPDLLTRAIEEVMTRRPKMIAADELAVQALNVMEAHQITSLFVHAADDADAWVGVLHLHDVLKAGLA